MIQRREFLAATGALAAASLFPPFVRGETPHPPTSGTPLRARSRIYKSCKWGMVQGKKNVLERFKLCKEIGFDGMELISPLDFEPGAGTLDDVLTASRETNMPVHGLVNIKANRRVHLASPDDATRARSRAMLEESLRNCHAYGGYSVLLVTGKVGPDGTHDDVWKRSIDGIRAVLPTASKLGVRILIETVWNGFCEKPDLLRHFIDEIGSPWVGVHLDLGNVRKFAPTEEWIRALGPRAVKLDIKDWSKKKGLCDIGEGVINWPAVRDALDEVGYSGWVVAEVKGGGRERLTKIARQMDEVLQIK